jgi:hypothetical protein
MSAENPSAKDDSKGEGILGIIGKIDTISSPMDYIKRFFYQILGIYFPPVVLILYLVLFWDRQPHMFSIPLTETSTIPTSQLVLPQNNLVSLFEFINNNNQVLILLLFIITVAAIGEAVNSLTSRIAKISPIKTIHHRERDLSIKGDRLPLIGRILARRTFPSHDPTKVSDWPIWLNITRFPVNFAHFDRYYVSVLEQDKKTLAGKIGWLSFYRNMTAIASIILILQSYLVIHISMVHENSLLDKHLYEYYTLGIAAASTGLFYLGHHAQVNAHRTTLWDAYRRNELRKNLEIRYGELSLSLGIKDKYKIKAIEYVVDRWFLAVEQTMQSLSSFLLTLVEQVYLTAKKHIEIDRDGTLKSFLDSSLQKVQEPAKSSVKRIDASNQAEATSLRKVEARVKQLLIDSYREWNLGGYTQVLSNTLKMLDTFHLSLTLKAWQTIRGLYNLENSMRTDAAFREVENNLINWRWTYQNLNKTNNSKRKQDERQGEKERGEEEERDRSITDIPILDSHYFRTKQELDQAANMVSRSIDPYHDNFDKIMKTLKELIMMRSGQLRDFQTLKVMANSKRTLLEVEVDGSKRCEVNVNEEPFKLEGNRLKVHLDGRTFVNTNDIKPDGTVLDINVRDELNKIYYSFGANNYNDAGTTAQALLNNLRIAQNALAPTKKKKNK